MTSVELRILEWTCGEVLHLIREYGNRPALWDVDCENYKNKFVKHHKWLELAAIFKCSKLEVERKMKILNSQFRRERLKAMRMRKLGLTNRVTWYGYRAFSFMNKQSARYKNKTNLKGVDGVNPIKEEIGDNNDGFNSVATSDLMPLLDQDDNNEPLDHAFSSVNENETFVNDNEQTSHKDGLMKIVYDNKDEWALFGELVGRAFRKLPDERTRCIVKHKINTILFEAELATYDSPVQS